MSLSLRLPQQFKRRHHQALQLISIKLRRPHPTLQRPLTADKIDDLHETQSFSAFIRLKDARKWSNSWASGSRPCRDAVQGLPEDDIGILSFPTAPGGKGKAADILGGVHVFLVTKSAPPEAVDFLKFFSQERYAKEAAAAGSYIPIYKSTATAITDPLFGQIAGILAQTPYPQNFLDQDLGPSVGHVINDVSVSVAES